MPGCAYWCWIVADDENGVTGVPSSKSHRYWIPAPPVTLAVNVTEEPATAGGGGGGVSSTKGDPCAIVQVKLRVSVLTPSVAETTTLYVPAADGVPVIAPVCAFTKTPGGSPVPPYVSASPFGSVAESCSETATPTWPDWLPGLTRTGATAGFCTGATPIFTIFAIEGVPAEFRTKSR